MLIVFLRFMLSISLDISWASHTSGTGGITGPIGFIEAGRNLAGWFVMGMSHEPAISSNPGGRTWGTYTPRSTWSNDYGSEFGVSILALPVDQTTIDSYAAFDIDASQLPHYLYLPRMNYQKSFSECFSSGVSGIYSPELRIYGLGLNISWTFLTFERFQAGVVLHYGQAWRNEFMHTETYGGSLLATWNFRRFDLYSGFNFIGGATRFKPAPGEESFGTISTHSEFGKSFLGGISYLLYRDVSDHSEDVIGSLQADFEQDHKPLWIAKLVFKIPTYRTHNNDLIE